MRFKVVFVADLEADGGPEADRITQRACSRLDAAEDFFNIRAHVVPLLDGMRGAVGRGLAGAELDAALLAAVERAKQS